MKQFVLRTLPVFRLPVNRYASESFMSVSCQRVSYRIVQYFNNPFIASNSGGGAIYSLFWLEGGPKPWGMASGTKGAAGLAQQRARH